MVMVKSGIDSDYHEQKNDYEIIAGTTFQDSDKQEIKEKPKGTSWEPAFAKYELEQEQKQNISSAYEVMNNTNSYLNISSQPTQKKNDKDFSGSVLRIHYIELILKALNEIVKNREEPTFLVNIHSLLWTLIEIRDTMLLDPLVEVTSAFYDALKCDNNWKDFSVKQYQVAIEVFEKISKQKKISDNIIAKSIQRFEESGFDTTPYAADIMEKNV